MKYICKLLSAALVVTILFCHVIAQGENTALTYKKGDQIRDFTFTTYQGDTYSLYDILKEKEAVLINIWASWCGPCRNEFPYLQEAYLEYQDKVEVIALSCESTDSSAVFSDFAEKYGLTFMIGQDPVDFLSALRMTSIPTTLVVDRFGTICFVEAGAQPDADSFKRLFDAFLGDDYTESVLLDGIPSIKPNVVSSTIEEIQAAIGSAAKNPTNSYVWPMIVTQKDGRSVVASTNASQASTRAEVTALLTAKEGDAICVTFKTSTEAVFDLMSISVNGKTIKSFGGEHDWMTYSIPVVSDGEYTVKVTYAKDYISDVGADTVWIDSIVLAENAEEALADNPAYPVAENTDIYVTNPDAREVTITDPNGLLAANFGDAKYYVINSESAEVMAALAADVDPEAAFLYFSYAGAGTQVNLIQAMTAEGYRGGTKVDSAATTKYLCSYAILYPDAMGNNQLVSLLFKDEDNLNSFVQHNSLGEWSYIEKNDDIAVNDDHKSSYVMKCIDQDGNPVAGVMLQICDEDTCQVLITDENGIYAFDAAAYAWEVHILRAPAGYTANSTEVVIAPVEGGELVFTLTAN